MYVYRNIPKTKYVWLILILSTILLIVFCTRFFLPRKKINNIILISLDTCRADYLGCYGDKRNLTPNIDSFSKKSFIFKNAVSPIPITLPSHSSIFTGKIPTALGIHDNFGYQLIELNRTLAEIMKEDKFVTGAIISSIVLDRQFGIAQGFDEYNDHIKQFGGDSILERRAGETTDLALNWLEKHKNDKFFFFLHYYDPHDPYEPPEPFASKHPNNLYAGEIAYTDSCLEKVFRRLKKLGLFDTSLIIIVGGVWRQL